MKLCSLTILALLVSATVLAQGQSPYDYFVDIAQIPSTSTTSTVTENVVVFVGNHGPFGGPYFDVTMTVKSSDGKVICFTGAATQPPLLKGQQRNVLEFQLTHSKAQVKGAVPKDKYLVFANIRTDYPNADTNPSNGTVSKEFSFPSVRVGRLQTSGTSSCKPLQ
jgi:hypothetical protein